MNIIIILFIIIIITLLFYFINNKGISENFDNKDKGKNENNTWTDSDKDYANKNPSFTQSQITEVKDISAQVSKNQLMDMITHKVHF